MEKEPTFEQLMFKIAWKANPGKFNWISGKNPVRFFERLGLMGKAVPQQVSFNKARATQEATRIVNEQVASKAITADRTARKITAIQEQNLRKGIGTVK